LIVVFKFQLTTDHNQEKYSLKRSLEDDRKNLMNLQEESLLRANQQHLDEIKKLDKSIEDRLRKLNEQVY